MANYPLSGLSGATGRLLRASKPKVGLLGRLRRSLPHEYRYDHRMCKTCQTIFPWSDDPKGWSEKSVTEREVEMAKFAAEHLTHLQPRNFFAAPPGLFYDGGWPTVAMIEKAERPYKDAAERIKNHVPIGDPKNAAKFTFSTMEKVTVLKKVRHTFDTYEEFVAAQKKHAKKAVGSKK